MANYGHICECGHYPSSHDKGRECSGCEQGCVHYAADQEVK